MINMKTLVDIGLTLNESKVYLALLKLNKSNAVGISKQSNVHRVNVYDSLEKLKEKGLVSEVKINKKKVFEASDPEMLSILVEEKANNLKKIIPQLELMKRTVEEGIQVGVHEGYNSMKKIYEEFLEKDEERLAFGGSKIVPEIFGSYFDSYHQRRIKLKRKLRVIYGSSAGERVKKLNKMSYTEAKISNKEQDSPVSTSILGNQVILGLWTKNPTFVVINNKKIADSYKTYFESLWKQSKK